MQKAKTRPLVEYRKILAPTKNKISTSPPQNPKYPPPQTKNFMGMGFFLQKERIFQVPIKFVPPFPAPELRATNFTDTRIFLKSTTD